MEGHAMKQEVRPSSAKTTQLTMAVAEMNAMVQSGCNEVSALSQLAQSWLQTPEGLRDPDVVISALRTIQHSAERLATSMDDEIHVLRNTARPEP